MGLRWTFWLGMLWLLFLAVSYYVPIIVDGGSNFEVKSTLLGTIIFYNPFILGLYALIGIVLSITGLPKK